MISAPWYNSGYPPRLRFPKRSLFTAERLIFRSCTVHSRPEFRILSQNPFDLWIILTIRVRRPCEHTTQESTQVFFIQCEPFVAGLAYLHDREIRRIGLSQQALRRYVIAVGFKLHDPSTTVNAPSLLPFVDEFFDLMHTEPYSKVDWSSRRLLSNNRCPSQFSFNGVTIRRLNLVGRTPHILFRRQPCASFKGSEILDHFVARRLAGDVGKLGR